MYARVFPFSFVDKNETTDKATLMLHEILQGSCYVGDTKLLRKGKAEVPFKRVHGREYK